MKKLEEVFLKRELPLLLFFILVFVLIRSVHFSQRLDFSTDQANLVSDVLDILRNRSPVLVGNRFTLEYNGRFMFIGAFYYYFALIFLWLGSFNPIVSSYLFMLFSALTIVPLYYGMKFLAGKNPAILSVVFYTLLPGAVNYSSFLWNPNFQFVLMPFLILMMGIFYKDGTKKNFFILSLVTGLVFQLHYIFLFILIGMLIYYFVIKRLGWGYFGLFVLGIFITFIPYFVFEIRNDFYNFRTLILFIQHWSEVIKTAGGINGDPHYLIPFVYFGLAILILFFRKKINYFVILPLFLVLLAWDATIYLPTPTHAYGMSSDWNYLEEAKAAKIIESQNLTDFNVTNLIYDTSGAVQKYLLKKDGVILNPDDYKANRYLFIITDKKVFLNDPSYEVKNINAQTVQKSWDINGRYKLYLAERNK